MKTLLQTLFSLSLLTQICFAQWVQVGLNNESIKNITVQNSNIFAITSDRGKVYRSIDNGTSWTLIVDSCAVDVAISPSGKVFMVKDSLVNVWWPSALCSSQDNGNTWTQIDVSIPPFGTPRGIKVSPSGIVFCHIGYPSGFSYDDLLNISDDEGLTWTTPGIEVRGGQLIDFRNQFTITYGESFAGGAFGEYIHLTSDNGNTWDYLGHPPGFSPTLLGLFTNGNVIMSESMNRELSIDSTIYISTNMCSTWTQIALLSSLVGISYSSGSLEGMLIGTDRLGVFLFSDEGDSLGSWNEGLTNLNVQSLTLDKNGYVYTGTQNGVWRRPLSEVTGVEENQIEIPSSYILSQNFPNPFNPSTKIKYSVPKISYVLIKVFDVLGNEVATLVNDEKPVGTYELNWNASNVPSGVYFYQLKEGEFIQTKKMILLK